MKTFFAVAGVVMFEKKVLILRKSLNDRNYPGKWSFVAGFSKEFEPAEEGILREIKEETGLDAKIIKKGKIIESIDEELQKHWIVLPFLCESDSDIINLCHENMEFKWIDPKEINNYDTVPGVINDLEVFNII